MKRILLFILPILMIVAAAFVAFGLLQVRLEKQKLMDELKRKAKTVAESIDLSAKYVLLNNDLKGAQRLVERFQARERLQGCVIYDKEGQILAITERFSDWREKEKSYIKNVLSNKIPRAELENFKEYSVYTYVIPVLDDDDNPLGLVEVIYDTAYVFASLTELWKQISVTLIILVLAILIIAFFVQRQIFTLPVQRLTEWFTHFQKGETDEMHSIKDKDELGKLANEVEQAALTLRVARRAISKEATHRIETKDLWTESRLKDLIHSKLGDNSLFVVSNREPYMHVMDKTTGKPACMRPASGVVTAINPILYACGGVWVAHGSGEMDRQFTNSKNKLGVPPEDHRYILKRVWLNKQEEEGYYYGFSNEGLWPLCHITHTRPTFREVDWQMYKSVNQKFADAVLEELPKKSPFIFIQDYHFTLLGKMIKEKRPDATVALFWHIPWPNCEVFSICPYQQEILDGMLGCDLVGFHVQYHCNNFLETANRLLECRVDLEKSSIVRSGHETLIRPFPISIDGYFNNDTPDDLAKEVEALRREHNLEGKIVGVGVERIDYTKGLLERFLAIDRFLEKYPEYKNQFVFVQLAAPSRTHIKRYHDFMEEIDELVSKVNRKHSSGNWKPIVYLKKYFSSDEIKPYYALGDLCIVSSLHDGMNLVAKEYIAAKNDLMGTLILSRFTGAARELTDAVQINPYSTEEFADSIRFAVAMPVEEKKRRMQDMRRNVNENNIYRWAASIIAELTSIRKD